jgi:hypothetical protein
VAIVAHSKLIRQLLAKLELREFVEGEDLPNTGIVVLDYGLDNKGAKFHLLNYGVIP